jgi:hypothetical protein
VTGASGFIGSALVPRLVAAGHTPRLFVRRAPATPPAAPVEIAQGDLTDAASLRAAVAGTDTVIHLGAATSAGRTDPAIAYRVNVGGASALVEACQAAGCRRIVAVSTQHVHLPRPGVYGRTKRIARRDLPRLGTRRDRAPPEPRVRRRRPGRVREDRRPRREAPRHPGRRAGAVAPPAGVGGGPERGHPLRAREGPRRSAAPTTSAGASASRTTRCWRRSAGPIGKPCRPLHLPIPLCFVLAWFLERLLPNPPLTTENVHGALVEAPCDLSALDRDLKPAITPFAEGLRQTLGRAA